MARKVLVVDDQPAALKVLGLALSREGYEVVGAQSGPEALQRIEEDHPDLVILDVMMPKMNGFEVCKRIRQTAATARLPVIMLTAMGDESQKLAGFDAGADDYLVKPVSLKELSARVRAVLARSGFTPSAASGVQEARVLAFIGVKGGVGTTTLAVNIAIAATQAGKSTILLDLHPQGGGAAAQLGQRPRKTLTLLLEQGPETLSPELVESLLISHESGLRVLPAPSGPTRHFHDLEAGHVNTLLNHLDGMADLLLLDLEPGLNPAREEAVRRAHRVALISEADPITLQMTEEWVEGLYALGTGGSAVHIIVVNRSRAATAPAKSEIEETLKRKILALIVPAPEMCLVANKTGTPILLQGRETPIASQLRGVAESLIGPW
jgi:DNA-binding response OmpR family regulator